MAHGNPGRPTARKRCPACGSDVPADGVFCPSCGANITEEIFPEPKVAPKALGHGTRDQRVVTDDDYVYPSVPPKSTALCLFDILLPGLAQIILGQVAKGIVIMVCFVASMFIMNCILWAVWLGSIVDAYQVAQKLQRGQPVRKWEFFPG